MAFRISEYPTGFLSGRPQAVGIAGMASSPTSSAVGPIQSQFSTAIAANGAAGTAFRLSGQTRFVLIDSDVGALVIFGSSIASTASPQSVTNTNGQHIPANVGPIPFYVQPGATLFVAST